MTWAYYNEHDPYAAAWLRNLINAGHIAPGIVDERSIEDVKPSDLAGFAQCHFFAGVGVWSYALRRAGWPDDRPVWTGSCPCQPFSAAGKGAGFADERHLWPAWFHLVGQCRPVSLFGEQVASKDADVWIDLVQADLEAMGYAFGAVPFPSAGIGAPHIRDRLYWMADSELYGPSAGTQRGSTGAGENDRRVLESEGRCPAGWMDNNNNNPRLEGLWGGHQAEGGRLGTVRPVAEAGEPGGVGNSDGRPTGRDGGAICRPVYCGNREPGAYNVGASSGLGGQPAARPINGFWRDVDWLFCRDGKWRPVEPGTFPLAHGASARVGRLRAYGNAINAEAAIAFIDCALDNPVNSARLKRP